ncbi:MAG: hypothetical protein HY788_00870 [Deltaproteobacteria bacterium]|nr:hypothetical protein [Deltaproteobacteria bacterium]
MRLSPLRFPSRDVKQGRIPTLFWGSVWVLAMLAVASSMPAYALTVKLSPAAVDLPASGASFDVEVAIEDVSDLGAFEFNILYDPSVVRISDANSVTLGPLLGSTGRSTMVLGLNIDNSAGKLEYGAFTLGGGAGPSGNGVLATVSFTVQNRDNGQLNPAEVKVTDTSGGALTVNSVQGATLSASAANIGPTANAGGNQSVQEGGTVTLNGSDSSDPDDGIETYSWVQLNGPTVNLINPSSDQVTFTAPDVSGTSSTLTFQLTVTDGGGFSDADTTVVTVYPAGENQPPTARAGADRIVQEGSAVVLDGSASSDPDDGIKSYSWVQTGGPAAGLTGASSAQASFTAPEVGAGGATLTFELTVEDQAGLLSSDSVVVTVADSSQNTAPVADAGPNQTVNEGAMVVLDGTGSSDSDDGIDSYAWMQTGGPQVSLSNANTVQASFTAPQTGSEGAVLTFLLTVTDKGGLFDTAPVSVTVTPGSGPVVSDMDGIYKDTKQTINAYVQTYATGEILVILTPDLEHWYVFLDPDWSDGITGMPDLANQGDKLSMSFPDNGEALAILTYGQGGSASWVLKRVFQGLQNSSLGDGIYKQDQSMNVYVQTYAAGSALFLFTPNALEWSVFLDSDYSNGISAPNDLANAGYGLVMTPSGSGAYNAVVTPPSGPADTYLLNRVHAAPKAVSGQ